MTRSPRPPRLGITLKVALPLMGIAIGCIVLGIALKQGGNGPRVSDVRRQITELALIKGDRPGENVGGLFGAWRLSARSADHLTGELFQLRLEGDSLLINAARATVLVDPDKDTIAFHLMDVDFAFIGEVPEDAPMADHFMQHKDEYVIGPIPWSQDIRADGSTSKPGVRPRQLTLPTVAGAPTDH
ncbi:MAG: hypothetical protein KC983_05190 [Phycisphaerales bacterium]|nr:hypothetical protein [Phycisphaerales bacterium]